MCGHLLGGGVGGLKNLEVIQASLVKAVNLVGQGVGLGEVRGLGEAIGGGDLSLGQPGSELLDAGLVLRPELDILNWRKRMKSSSRKKVLFVLLEAETHLREVVALLLDLLLQVGDVLGDPVQLILVCLGIFWNLLTWKKRGSVLKRERCLPHLCYIRNVSYQR